MLTSESNQVISEVLHSKIRQKDSARGSEVENAHEDSACLFGKSSLCRKYFSDEFSCRRALARDLFKEVSYLGILAQASVGQVLSQLGKFGAQSTNPSLISFLLVLKLAFKTS